MKRYYQSTQGFLWFRDQPVLCLFPGWSPLLDSDDPAPPLYPAKSGQGKQLNGYEHTDCSSRGSRFDSQSPYDSSQPSVTHVPGDKRLFWPLYIAVQIHMQAKTPMHIINKQINAHRCSRHSPGIMFAGSCGQCTQMEGCQSLTEAWGWHRVKSCKNREAVETPALL